MKSFFLLIEVCLVCIASLSAAPAALSQTGFTDLDRSSDPVVIIGHKDVPVDSLTASQVSEFYSLQNITWSDGSLVYLFDLKTNSDQKKAFYQFIDSDTRAMRQIWMRAVLSGEVKSPKITRSSSEMVAKVGGMEGGLGYARASEVNDQVKILAIVD